MSEGKFIDTVMQIKVYPFCLQLEHSCQEASQLRLEVKEVKNSYFLSLEIKLFQIVVSLLQIKFCFIIKDKFHKSYNS